MARMRTFIAVELEEGILSRLVALQQTLGRAGGDVKWVERENLHVTLVFLGEVDERDLNDVCQAVAGATADIAPFDLVVEGVGCFGNPRKPRTIWAGIEAGTDELIALHAAIEQPLLELGCYRREDRKFTPHITLGRVRGESDPLAEAITLQQRFRAGDCQVVEVAVMSSELRPEGPVYAVLSRAALGGD